MRGYTSVEQSKKLAEILPLESADMCWTNHCYGVMRSSMTVASKTIEEYKELLTQFADLTDIDVFYPCWSLAALLEVLPTKLQIGLAINDFQGDRKEKYVIGSVEHDRYDCYADNPVDAGYEMVLKLHKENLL